MRRKIRIYSPYYPFPVTEGAYQVIYDQVLTLSANADVELVTWKESKMSIATKLQGNDPFNGKVKLIHWDDSLLPATKKETTVHRILRTLSSLFSSDSSPGLFYYPVAQDRRSELESCDLAIYHYAYAWTWLSREKSKSTQIHREKKRVIHLHNLESDLFDLRAEREANLLYRSIHRLNAKKLRRQEAQLSQLANELWFVSEPDWGDYQRLFRPQNVQVHIRPPTYQAQTLSRRAAEFADFLKKSKGSVAVAGFVGALDFDPNRASVEWLVDFVCPILEEKKWKGRIIIAGRNASEKMIAKLKSRPNIHYLGFVQDMSQFWQQLSVMLVPHVAGSGVRVKLLDALASGIPVLANTPATERIEPSLKSSELLTVLDDPEKWAQYLMNLEGHELRQSFAGQELLPGLSGQVIYKDLL